MLSVLVVRHGDDIPAGHFLEAAAIAGVSVDEVLLFEGDTFPDASAYDGIAVFGGAMGAYDTDEYPWLKEEKAYLKTAAEAGMPILGICLGCQLLADSLGGSAFKSPTGPEIGVLRPDPTPEAEHDPVFSHLDGPVPVWHQDSWVPPPGSTLLAATHMHPHAFRLGSVVGIQGHPEADRAVVAGWVEHEGTGHFEQAGVDPDRFIADIDSQEAEQREMALRLFGAWFSEVDEIKRRSSMPDVE